MKKIAALLVLSFVLQATAWADTVVYTRKTSFPKFGAAKTVYTIDASGPYRHTKTVLENRDEVPAYAQVGFKQKHRYYHKRYDQFKMIMWH